MVRISAFLIALCMVLIAASLGVVVYARFGFTGAELALAGVGALTALTVYYAVAARKMIAWKRATSLPSWRAAPAIWRASLPSSAAV